MSIYYYSIISNQTTLIRNKTTTTAETTHCHCWNLQGYHLNPIHLTLSPAQVLPIDPCFVILLEFYQSPRQEAGIQKFPFLLVHSLRHRKLALTHKMQEDSCNTGLPEQNIRVLFGTLLLIVIAVNNLIPSF
jgi:hypothetical protein